ncbi:hypothetical protein EDB82DRAFT_453872 [Fusarium venenatum]|uniref:uncharacterized protein n=1 Tax=Fusarium venenatum TaxID=56646 RepID=UPI001DA52673|nr:hypothetical protein EDB82DRAFT_453872 [Fusarium venenatum]
MPPEKFKCFTSQTPTFVFVDTSEATSNGTSSQDTKVSVRRQAARSGRKSHQYKQSLKSNTSVPASDSWKAFGGKLPTGKEPNEKIPLQPSPKGYESLRAVCNFDIVDLATFTEVDLATNAHLSLQKEPGWRKEILNSLSPSFLMYLPSRYGQDPFLDDAIHCVTARAGQMVGFPMKHDVPELLYGKALMSLQKVISDGSFRPTANCYGAARLLGLYELLGEPIMGRLFAHFRGSIKLLELRKPALYESAFDRALLKSHGPSIVVDELYRNSTSMFQDPDWQSLFRHAATLEKDNESSYWWKFFSVTTSLPGILKDMRNIFATGAYQYGDTDESGKVLNRANNAYKQLHANNALYQREPPHASSLFNLPVSPESSERIRLREFFLYTMIYMCRIRATLSTEEIERYIAEVEAQTFATQALLIQKTANIFDRNMAWHLEQRNGLAHSVIQTRTDWLSDTICNRDRGELHKLLAQRWLKWESSWRNSVLEIEYRGEL